LSCTDLGLFLKEKLLSNNSAVIFDDIGEGNSALYCVTNGTIHCGANAGGEDHSWKFPNGTPVGEDATTDVYFTRGFSSLILNRKSSAVGPTGVYTCVIPDASNTSRTLYVTVFTEGQCVSSL
jgi:hypothetical protein